MKFWSRVVMAAAVAIAMSIAVAYAATAPSRVTRLSATAGDQQVTVSWSAPTSGTPPFTYTVTGSPGGYTSNDSTTTRTITNLTNGTAYTFKVFPANSTGGGPGSTITVTPHASPPGPPTNLGATPGPGGGQITLSWTPPTSSGSSPDGTPPGIDHYTVSYSPGGTSQQVNAATNTFVVSNLADNITYTFTVSATNARSVIGPAALIYSPLPSGATIGLDPSAGGASTDITVTGQLFLHNESITLYWDDPSHVAASVVTDTTGAFTKVVKPFSGDKPKVHKLCATVPPKPCGNFTLQGPPTPTPAVASSPTDTSSPSPAQTSNASAARTGGGFNGLDVITRPPFVFLPIIGILGLLGVVAYWAMSRRGAPTTPTAATVTHRATRPDYMAPFPTAAQPPVAPPPAQLIEPAWEPPVEPAWQAPVQSPPPSAPAPATPPPAAAPPPAPWQPPVAPPPPWQPPAAPTWPASPDEPPDLPEPSD